MGAGTKCDQAYALGHRGQGPRPVMPHTWFQTHARPAHCSRLQQCTLCDDCLRDTHENEGVCGTTPEDPL